MEQPDVQRIPVSQLNPAEYNPRVDLKPGDPVYEKLRHSVESFGYVEPIVWNRRTGNIVGGHQRFKVLRDLLYDEIDCVVVDMDEGRERALNIALNKIQGEWEPKKLMDVFESLDKYGIDRDLTGFDREETLKLFQRLQRTEGKIAEDDFDADAEAEAIETPISKPGDIWLMGPHRLICGDSTDIGVVARLMDGAKAKMVFTDPPWNVDYGGAKNPKFKRRAIKNDNMSKEAFYEFLMKSFKSMASVSVPGALTYVVMSAQEWGRLMLALEENSYHWSSTIIWAKDTLVLSQKDYHTQYEPIWFGWLEGAPRLCPLKDRGQSDLWEIDRPKKSPDHPTTKPVALPARAIGNSSEKGDIVLDLFGGSGTTLLAAEQTGRVCYMSEEEACYVDTIVKRYTRYKESDEGVFLLRDGKKHMYHETMEL